jgi:hypothetical protein
MLFLRTQHLMVMLSALLLAAGCANRNIIIDPKGVNMTQYNQDLSECTALAEQVNVGGQTAGRALAGAAVGAAIGAAVGNSDTAQRGAGVGAVAGGAEGAGRAASEKQAVVRNCLRNRGYSVLN